MFTELSKGITSPGAPEVYRIFELTAPDATTKRWATSGLASAARGLVEGRVESVSGVSRSIDPLTPNVQITEVSVGILDTDRTFAALVHNYRSSLRRSVAKLVLISPNVADASAFTQFSGILEDWTQDSPFRWTLRLRLDDRPLARGIMPKPGWAIAETEWPNAHADAVGKFPAIVYGIHDSRGTTAAGMLPTLYVDTSGFRYLVSVGHISSVDRVYKDNIEVVSGWAITKVKINGKLYTLVDFTSTQGSSVITVDAQGLTSATDGTGTVYTNPSDQLKHLLVNFGFGNWRSESSWVSDSSYPVSTTLFSAFATYCTDMGFEGSMYIGTDGAQENVLEVVQQWCESWDAKLVATNDGKFGPVFLDHRAPSSLYFDAPWIRDPQALSFGAAYSAMDAVREINLTYCHNEAQGKNLLSLKVADLSRWYDSSENLDLFDLAARVY
jgi:hypothetical protein